MTVRYKKKVHCNIHVCIRTFLKEGIKCSKYFFSKTRLFPPFLPFYLAVGYFLIKKKKSPVCCIAIPFQSFVAAWQCNDITSLVVMGSRDYYLGGSLPADVLWGSFVTHSFLPNEPKDVCGEATWEVKEKK